MEEAKKQTKMRVWFVAFLSYAFESEWSEAGGGGVGGVGLRGGWTQKNAKKQQTVRWSSRQRPTREVKSGEAGRGGWKIDAKNAWVQALAAGSGGVLEVTPKTPGPEASADICTLARGGACALGNLVWELVFVSGTGVSRASGRNQLAVQVCTGPSTSLFLRSCRGALQRLWKRAEPRHL